MWRAVEWGLSVRDRDMSDKKNATFHETSTLDIMESLKICMQLLDHSWQSGQSGRVVWQDARDTAIEGCKGLITMSTEKHFQELTRESHMWFVLFLTFTGISLTAVAALVYLISTMRTFVSLRKCLVSSWESQEKRPDPQSLTKSLRSPLNTRPVVQNWASTTSTKQTFPLTTGQTHTTPQLQTGSPVQHQVNYPIQPQKYPVTISPISVHQDANSETQVSVRTADQDEAKILAVKMKADLEEKYMEYQRSLWDLQKAIPNGALGAPPTLYPTLPAQPEEGMS